MFSIVWTSCLFRLEPALSLFTGADLGAGVVPLLGDGGLTLEADFFTESTGGDFFLVVLFPPKRKDRKFITTSLLFLFEVGFIGFYII
jgi:hypothetical protein